MRGMREVAKPVIATRIDLRAVASAILYYESQMENDLDIMPDTVSEVVRWAFEDRVRGMMEEQPQILVKSYEDALRVFTSRRFKVPQRNTSMRAIRANLLYEQAEQRLQHFRPDFMPPPLNEENNDKEDVEQGRSRAPQSIGADNKGEAEGALKSA